MAHQTNLTVAPSWQLTGNGGRIEAVPVYVCEVCGVLQINPPNVYPSGAIFTPQPHAH